MEPNVNKEHVCAGSAICLSRIQLSYDEACFLEASCRLLWYHHPGDLADLLDVLFVGFLWRWQAHHEFGHRLDRQSEAQKVTDRGIPGLCRRRFRTDVPIQRTD